MHIGALGRGECARAPDPLMAPAFGCRPDADPRDRDTPGLRGSIGPLIGRNHRAMGVGLSFVHIIG
ncbi:hypothetical protein GCM10009573_26990 [Agromyces bracchium]